MYVITPEEIKALMEKLRNIRKQSGEMIAFLEHMRQLQDNTDSDQYDPDEYLQSWIPNELD